MFAAKEEPAEKRARLSDEEYQALKTRLKERKKLLQAIVL